MIINRVGRSLCCYFFPYKRFVFLDVLLFSAQPVGVGRTATGFRWRPNKGSAGGRRSPFTLAVGGLLHFWLFHRLSPSICPSLGLSLSASLSVSVALSVPVSIAEDKILLAVPLIVRAIIFPFRYSFWAHFLHAPSKDRPYLRPYRPALDVHKSHRSGS